MVTGIEAAGVALGLFPLVIEGIKFYVSFAKQLKQMKHHKHTLQKFRRDLIMEKTKFNNTWYTLVGRAGEHIEPNTKPSSKTIESVLSCLPKYAVGSFVDGCQELNTILEKLIEKFIKYEQSAGYRKMLTVLQHFTTEDQQQYIGEIFTLNFNLDKLVNGAPQVAAVEENKLKKVNVAGHYQRVRMHAIILYGALKDRLQKPNCPCKIPHSANLQLDVCIPGIHNESYNHDPNMRRLSLLFPVLVEQTENEECFTLRQLEFETLENLESSPHGEIELRRELSVFSLHSTTDQPQLDATYTASEENTKFTRILLSALKRGLKFMTRNTFQNSQKPERNKKKVQKPERSKTKKKVEFSLIAAEPRSSYVQSSPVPSVPEKIIECFCSAIRDITEMCTCVGILVGSNSKHQVWVRRAALTSTRILSLAELLSLPEPPRSERLKLGVRLASSVLQLHKTEWLQERWGKQDIYFVQGGSSHSKSPSLETPVVRQAFTPEPSAPEPSMEPRNIISCNLSLFSLGIVLIELWFWRSVESFQADEPQAYHFLEDLDTTRYITADRLIEKLYRDAGDIYGDIVRRCIKGLDHRETHLENEGFKNEVYLKVLQPLENFLGFFFHEPLEEIFLERERV